MLFKICLFIHQNTIQLGRIYNIQSGNSLYPVFLMLLLRKVASLVVSTSTQKQKQNVDPEKMADPRIFDLSKLISNQGYDCIVEAIFTKLDPTLLIKCRSVSKSWKALIDTRRTILVYQLQQLKQNKLEIPDAKVWYKLRRIFESQRKYSIIEKFPELRQVFLDLEKNATGHELSIIVMFLWKYSKHQKFPMETLEEWEKRILMSPLHQAIIQGAQEFISIIMKRTKFDFQLSIQLDAEISVTYLTLAIHNQTMVQLLLNHAIEKHLNLNVPDEIGRTAFHFACLEDKKEVIQLFLENVKEEFLQVNLVDKNGYSPLKLACIANQPEAVQLLLERSIQNGIDINPVHPVRRTTLLHSAAKIGWKGHEKVVKVLLEASVKHEINVNAFDINNWTPFATACFYGHLKIAKLMIQESRKYGIDLNCLDSYGNSALYHAIANKHLEIARVIIDESKDKGIILNQEQDSFITDLLAINAWINSVGGLVYGRRLDLWNWNPLKISYFCSKQLRDLHLMKSMICKWKWNFFICLCMTLLSLHYAPSLLIYLCWAFVSYAKMSHNM